MIEHRFFLFFCLTSQCMNANMIDKDTGNKNVTNGNINVTNGNEGTSEESSNEEKSKILTLISRFVYLLSYLFCSFWTPKMFTSVIFQNSRPLSPARVGYSLVSEI